MFQGSDKFVKGIVTALTYRGTENKIVHALGAMGDRD